MTRDLHRPVREAWIVSAVRTPVGRSAGALKDVRPESLPIDAVRIDPAAGRLEFRAGGKSWRCDLRAYELAEGPAGESPSLRTLDAPRPSRRTGAETSIAIANRTDGKSVA